jgi:dCMP deaminase
MEKTTLAMTKRQDRPSWYEYAMGMAIQARTRSEDPHYQVGAYALKVDNTSGPTGYNGTPPGVEIDWSDRDLRRDFVIHAEVNCLNWVLPGECKLIAVTTMPCPSCMALIASKKIPVVLYDEIYKTDPTVEARVINMAKIFNIELIHQPSNKKV